MDFTIVTASYNYGHYIGECLESVAYQQGVTFEHLVMDAGSTDDTAEIVARHPHASFFQEPDKGMSDGINKGFLKAQGNWVMWLNADDRLRPGALKSVKKFARKRPEADVVFGCWDFIDANGEFIRRMTVFPFNRGMIFNHGCYIASTATFYRRSSTIGEGHLLNIQFRSVMDGEYYARLSSLGKRFEYLPRVLADFRLHDESISQRNLGRADIDGVLAHQHQLAESRAIRRVYGLRLFRDEMLNGIVEGIVYHAYRLLKGILKMAHRGRTLAD
ncbi:MAG: glycosyltransferase [Verrucomicrobiae bacterium]|nr:glycosyltransferase [Verrucomicrobiae bacterium]